ncbi:MAG: radical SAM protein [Myxococcales bacterium]|nr:radical SAM protein [Myxococcales bacterium]
MRVLICYPPIESAKGSPMLTQNRQFQWFHEPSYLYPCIPASAATLLQSNGHDVRWVDCIAERKNQAQFERLLEDFKPELVAMETKSPVIKMHWKIVERIKELVPGAQCVLFGDHIAGNPAETLEQSQTDYCIQGGDYDFSLQSLVDWISKGTKLGGGIWWKENGTVKSSGAYNQEGNLEELPFWDRDLTNAHLYFEKWKYRLPFMWTMAGRDCPYGRCTFCSWTVTYPKFRTVSPERLATEMEMLINKHGAKNIFDDTGALPTGNWLTRLCGEMIDRKINEKVVFDCNFRFDYFTEKNVHLMKKAGFRKLILGIESASERTIDILDKSLTRQQIIEGCKMASAAGLQPHLTMMVGYPWETKEDAYETLSLAKYLMYNGYAAHLQATVVMPYPGTPLFDLCQKNGWIRFDPLDYERYDMTEPACVLTDMDQDEVVQMAGQFYKLYMHPRFLANQLKNLRSMDDLDYMRRGVTAIWGHIKDFASIRNDHGSTGGSSIIGASSGPSPIYSK